VLVLPCLLRAPAKTLHWSVRKPNLEKNLALLLPSGWDDDSKYSTIFARSTRALAAYGNFMRSRRRTYKQTRSSAILRNSKYVNCSEPVLSPSVALRIDAAEG